MPRKKEPSSATFTAAAPASKVTSIESRPATATHSNGDVANVQHPIEERIRQRAYELYEQRGRFDGAADQDWLRAEAELRATAGKRSA